MAALAPDPLRSAAGHRTNGNDTGSGDANGGSQTEAHSRAPNGRNTKSCAYMPMQQAQAREHKQGVKAGLAHSVELAPRRHGDDDARKQDGTGSNRHRTGSAGCHFRNRKLKKFAFNRSKASRQGCAYMPIQ